MSKTLANVPFTVSHLIHISKIKLPSSCTSTSNFTRILKIEHCHLVVNKIFIWQKKCMEEKKCLFSEHLLEGISRCVYTRSPCCSDTSVRTRKEAGASAYSITYTCIHLTEQAGPTGSISSEMTKRTMPLLQEENMIY